MLDQIKQRRLSDIICENTDIATITDNVFIQVAANCENFAEREFINCGFSRDLATRRWNALLIGSWTSMPWQDSCKQNFEEMKPSYTTHIKESQKSVPVDALTAQQQAQL